MKVLNKKDVCNYMKYALSFNKYIEIMERYRIENIKESKEFQTVFNNFYKLGRHKKEWYKSYYSVFENNKNNKKVNFCKLLKEIENKTKTVEISFASKMLHTINPNYPIYDSNVKEVLKLRNVKGENNKQKIESACEIYNDLREKYKNLKYLVKIFDDIFPSVNMSSIKKIDTILYWKGEYDRNKKASNRK